jgi:hypothetical protein
MGIFPTIKGYVDIRALLVGKGPAFYEWRLDIFKHFGNAQKPLVLHIR